MEPGALAAEPAWTIYGVVSAGKPEQRDRVIAQALGELIVSSPELERQASVASLRSSR